MSEPGAPGAPRDNPYFGLEYFDERFGAWFFGREAEGSKVITNLRAARLTLLHAESGVGKSSLLRAGVAWRMRRHADDMFARRRAVRSVPVVFTSWKDDPCRELAGSVTKAIQPYLGEGPAPALSADRLDLALEAASAAVNANLLIMLDQFEEYFLYRSQEPVPERFADELARCVNRTDLRANFLIAIREDAYAGLGDLFKGRIPNVYGNYLHIDYLDRAAAERAIREPLGVYNRQCDASQQVTIENELVTTVLNEIPALDGDDNGGYRPATNGSIRIATPLLQLVMERVWNAEHDEGSHELRLATLQKLHGVKMIAGSHLDKALGSLSRAERNTAIDTFDRLVTPSGGKIAESVANLARRTGHKEQQVGAVLAKLDRERIVRPVPAAPGQDPERFRRYEIFHDVLASTINRTITARDERRRGRRRWQLAGLITALVLVLMATALSLVSLVAVTAARNEALAADSRQLAAEAQLYATSNPTRSTQLALAALRVSDTPQAEQALRAALPGVQTVQTIRNGTTVSTAAFDPADPAKVLSGDRSGVASIWDVTTGQRLVRMSLGGFAVTGGAVAAFNPSGTEVAVGYSSGEVAVFDAVTGRKLRSAFAAGRPPVNGVAFLGTSAIAIASQGGLALWLPGSGCCAVLTNEPSATVAADPGDPRRFVSTTGGAAIIWDTSGPGQPQQHQLGTVSNSVSANDAEFSPDGSTIVTAESDGSVRIYNVARPFAALATLNAGDGNALTAAFSPAGTQIAAGYSSGTARVWDVATRLPLTLLAGSASRVLSAQFSPDGGEVVTAGEDGTIRVWYAQPRDLRELFTIPAGGGTPDPVAGADYIADRIIALGQSGRLEVFTADGAPQAVISEADPVTSAAWDGAGTRIVTADVTGAVSLWRAVGMGYRLAFTSHANAPEVAMSADGSVFAARAGTYGIEIWSADTERLLRTLNAFAPVNVLAVGPGGRQVAAGDGFGQVEVWNGNGTVDHVLGPPGPPILDIAYDQSGREFVTASAAGIVTVWDAAGGRPLISVSACQSPGTASFSPDGSKIVVACGDGTVRVFAAATGQPLVSLPATSVGVVSAAAFSPDGRSIVAAINAANSGDIQVWSAVLATPSLAVLERIAEQRVPQLLTPAEQQQYLVGIGG